MQTIRNRRARGFTLIEALVIVGIIGVLVAIGVPALQQMILRSKLEGLARETAAMMQSARYQAIKEANPTVIQIDTATGEVMSYVDVDADKTFTPILDGSANDRMLKVTSLSSGLTFRAEGGELLADKIDGFETSGALGLVVFNTDGSAEASGAVRIADARDNFLEIRIEPRATARVEVQKWNEDEEEYLAQGEKGFNWQWRSTPRDES